MLTSSHFLDLGSQKVPGTDNSRGQFFWEKETDTDRTLQNIIFFIGLDFTENKLDYLF